MGTGDGAADAANLAGSLSKDIYRDVTLTRHGSDYGSPMQASGGHGGGIQRRGRRRERVRLQEARPHSADGSSIAADNSRDQQLGNSTNGGLSSNAGSSLNVAFSLVRKVSARVSGNKSKEHPLKRRASRRARAAGSIRRPRRQGSNRLERQSSVKTALSRRRRHNNNGEPEGSPNHTSGVDDPETGDPLINPDSHQISKKSVRQSVVGLLTNGWRQIQFALGLRKRDVVNVQEIINREPILEDLEMPHRYRPENLKILCEATGFSVSEMKRIYRGFKTECPTGLITEEAFHSIYARFFPNGAHFLWKDLNGKVRSSLRPVNPKQSKKERKEALNSQANVSSYPHYVFSTLDHEDTGVITFGDFVVGLSILLRGSLEEKLRWMFALYDQDRDGFISREEMEDVVGSVFDLVGRTSDPILEEEVINERVNRIFQKMDLNGDGVVSMDEFLQVCLEDENITRSISAFANVSI